MNPDTVVFNAAQEELLSQLAHSRSRILALAQQDKIEQTALYELANSESELALSLSPMPLEPGEHLRAAHARARPYLERLINHDPARVIVADETHSYTPRKILRRILDHALDHLNQIEQWLAWQQQGIVPVPTDGWASSADTFQEDSQSLSAAELQSWLWRIDLVIGLMAQRAAQLSEEQLDWQPPDGGWTLRHAIHHLALIEVFYVVWLDEPLPDGAGARYHEANRRFEQQLRAAFALPAQPGTAMFDPSGESMITAEQAAQLVLEQEQAMWRRNSLRQ